jgi:spermidine synthase
MVQQNLSSRTVLPGTTSTGTFVLACALFCVSGVAGLIYELIWVRELTALLGAGIYAISAVLAAFMGGLALGAAAAARFADRLRRPFGAYSVLELLIAGSGLAIRLVWRHFAVFDTWAYGRWGDVPQVLALSRFAAVTLVLLVPTTLMGATLPVMARAVVNSRSHLGGRVGWLYAVNTLGTVVGVFLTGFYLLDRFGIQHTGWIAASLNLAAGIGALGLTLFDPWPRSSRAAAVTVELTSPPGAVENVPDVACRDPDGQRRAFGGGGEEISPTGVVGACMFLSGFAALAAEVLWSRTLIFLFDDRLRNTTYCFSALLTVYLAGIVLGSACVGLIVDRLRQPLKCYGLVLSLVGVSFVASAAALHSGELRAWIGPASPAAATLWLVVATMMLKTAVVLGLPTFLMGVSFPIAIRAAVSANVVGAETGRLYSLNTLGSVCGSLAAGFVIIPLVGLTGGLLLLAIIEGALGVACLWRSRGRPARILAPGLLLVAITAAAIARPFDHGGLATLHPDESLVYYDEGAVATVSIAEDNSGQRRICVDDVPVAGTSLKMQTDQKSLAHVPMLLIPEPRNALTVGFGSGGTSYSLLLYNCLEKVHCVEICPGVVRAAGQMTASNHGFLERHDPRYRVIFDDARAYLRGTREVYDVIATDCTDLRYKSSANLYDVEYFQLCRDRLRGQGLVIVWMPLGGLSDMMFRTTLRTFQRVFPEMAVFYMHNDWTHYVLLAGGHERLKIDFSRLLHRIGEPHVHADLESIGLDNPYKLLATFTTSGPALAEYLRGDLVNTQDRPVLEFEAPRLMAGQFESIQANLDSLMRFRVPVDRWLMSTAITDEQRATLRRYEQAVPFILAAQWQELTMNIEAATEAYLHAARVCPDDVSLQRSLEFPRFAKLAGDGNPTAWVLLGRSQQLQKHYTLALEHFERYFAGLRQIDEGTADSGVADTLTMAIRRQALAWRTTAERWQRECRLEVNKAVHSETSTEQ